MNQEQSLDVLKNVKEVKSIYHEDQVNKLLGEGWILLSVAKGQEQTGSHDYTPVFKYSLGKIS